MARRAGGRRTPRLAVVGIGIQIGRDLTPAARFHIKAADKVFYLVADIIAERLIRSLNSSAESLHTSYSTRRPRLDSYHEMIDRILAPLREGKNVCAASYGHPGVLAYAMQQAVRRARNEGFDAMMLPAVSSVDCLIADLGLDPGERGLQIFDASDFLLRRRRFDRTSTLVLLQIATTGDPSFKYRYGRTGLRLLAERLGRHYGAGHEAVLYEAPEIVMCPPIIKRTRLGDLPSAGVGVGSTLLVPPKGQRALNHPVLARLGLRVERKPVKRKRKRGAAITTARALTRT